MSGTAVVSVAPLTSLPPSLSVIHWPLVQKRSGSRLHDRVRHSTARLQLPGEPAQRPGQVQSARRDGAGRPVRHGQRAGVEA